MGEGLASLQRRMAAIPKATKQAVVPALLGAAAQVVSAQKLFAEMSRDTGSLIDSFAITGPGEETPAYSQPGGAAVVPENAVAITVGNTNVRYAHLVEHGTKNAEAQPFFFPGFRLSKKKALAKIKRALRKAVKDTK